MVHGGRKRFGTEEGYDEASKHENAARVHSDAKGATHKPFHHCVGEGSSHISGESFVLQESEEQT